MSYLKPTRQLPWLSWGNNQQQGIAASSQGAQQSQSQAGAGEQQSQAYYDYRYETQFEYNGFSNKRTPVDPLENGHNFLHELDNIDPMYIQEIVVVELIYMQVLELMGLKDKDEALKSFTYSLPLGRILLRNAKYQLDLDKYLEDGPTEEV